MVHWAFLILAFICGFAACYALLYQLEKVAARVEHAIDEGVKKVRF